MLSYFPAIYPDELLYSVIARWLLHQGAVGMTQPLEHVFGRRLASASVDLPGWIGHLASALPAARGLSADALINQSTLFPYYTAYVPEPLRKACRQAMCSGATSGWHMRLGIAAFRVKQVRRLRFCSLCLQEMKARYGEFYWKRCHQLPGIVVCPEHGCALQVSHLQPNVRGRFEYVAATYRECSSDCPRVEIPTGKALARLWEVARRSASLLTDPGNPRDLATWTAHYRLEMARSGLAWSPQRMRQAELLVLFHEFYGEAMDYLSAECEGLELSEKWLPSMVRKHRKVAHPLQHIMLEAFLASRSHYDGPFGQGPWPCCNPLAGHVGALTISAVIRHRNHGHDVGVFRCGCGYVYTRRFLHTSGILESPRVREFGPLLDTELRRLVECRSTLRAAARALRIDPKTAARRAHALQLGVTWKIPDKDNAQSERPSSAPAVMARKRARVARPKRLPRRKWVDIDDALAEKIHVAADAVRKLDPPHRVTHAELERRLGSRDWVSKRLLKLPKCSAALAGEIEDDDAFHDRRIEWAVQALYEGSTNARLWQLAGKVGLTAEDLRNRLNCFAARAPH